MDYQKDLEIDKFALDAECLDQARRFMVWSEQLANAMADRDHTEQKLKVTEAQVEQNIRNNPPVEKLTEAGVKSLIILNEGVKKIHEEFIEASHKANIMLAAKQAMEQRRSMLENLVKLYLSGYWADPKIKAEDGDKMTQASTNREQQALEKSPRLQKRTK